MIANNTLIFYSIILWRHKAKFHDDFNEQANTNDRCSHDFDRKVGSIVKIIRHFASTNQKSDFEAGNNDPSFRLLAISIEQHWII